MKTSFLAMAAAGTIALGTAAQASVIELNLTGSWRTSDFDVSSTGTTTAGDPPEVNDDKVFGIAPSDGSVSFTLLVDTSTVSTHLVGGGGAPVVHDFFGYTGVTLKDPVTLGSASWNSSDILTSLLGPDGVSAALWTDTDLTTGDPTRVSFRMFGDWAGTGGTGTADMFFGSRIAGGSGMFINSQFLTWEYYQGEEIRSSDYTATVGAVPLPASSVLLLAGLGGLSLARRKRKA